MTSAHRSRSVSRVPRVLAVGAAVALFGGLTACGGNGSLGDIQVASASISGVQWASVDVVVGVSWASGVLNVVDTSGQSHSAKVNLSGPAVGLVLDVSGADFSGTTVTLSLPPNKSITVNDLLDTYAGNDEGFHLVIGGEQHNLSNSAGVQLSGGNFDLGFGVFVGYEWMSISLASDGSTGSTSGPTAIAASSGSNGTIGSSSTSSSGHTSSLSSSSSSSSSSGSISASSATSSGSSSSGRPAVIQVTLSDASFLTSGANLFNCNSPEYPPAATTVSLSPIVCDPLLADAGYSPTRVTVTSLVGCGSGNGAVVQVTCGGTPSNRDVTGSVTLAIIDTCDSNSLDGGFASVPVEGDAGSIQPDGGPGTTFEFEALAPSETSNSPLLGTCADPGNICVPTNTCAFNEFTAKVNVSNVGP